MRDAPQIEKINPIEYLSRSFSFGDSPRAHITYDPNVEPQYRIIRGSSHDGTLLFTNENLERALEPLVNMRSYFVPEPPDPANLASMEYVIGDIEIKREFGLVDLPAGRFPGVEETVTIPVRCRLIHKSM